MTTPITDPLASHPAPLSSLNAPNDPRPDIRPKPGEHPDERACWLPGFPCRVSSIQRFKVRKETGKPFADYVARVRVHEGACEACRRTPEQVAQITGGRASLLSCGRFLLCRRCTPIVGRFVLGQVSIDNVQDSALALFLARLANVGVSPAASSIDLSAIPIIDRTTP